MSSLFLLVTAFAAVNAFGNLEDLLYCIGYCREHPDDNYSGKGCLIGCLDQIEELFPGRNPFVQIDWWNPYNKVDASTQTEPVLTRCEDWCEGADRHCPKEHKGDVHNCTSVCKEAQNRSEPKARKGAIEKLRDILSSCILVSGSYQ